MRKHNVELRIPSSLTLSEKELTLAEGLAKIVAMNLQYAEDKYGDPYRVESYACVKHCRYVLTQMGFGISTYVENV